MDWKYWYVQKNIAINGFGRIGRLAFRQLLDREGVRVVGINDLTDVNTLAHLLKFDSVHGRFAGEVSVSEGHLVVNGETIHITAERNPADLPWSTLKVDVVVESTGVFATVKNGRLYTASMFKFEFVESTGTRIRMESFCPLASFKISIARHKNVILLRQVNDDIFIFIHLLWAKAKKFFIMVLLHSWLTGVIHLLLIVCFVHFYYS